MNQINENAYKRFKQSIFASWRIFTYFISSIIYKNFKL